MTSIRELIKTDETDFVARLNKEIALGHDPDLINPVEWAKNVEVQIKRLPTTRRLAAEARAIHKKQRWALCRRHNSPDCAHFDSVPIGDKATISHVRHNYSNYESLILKLKAVGGCQESYSILKSRFDDAIIGKLCWDRGKRLHCW